MKRRLFKTMVAVLAIAAAAAGPVRGQNASPDVTLDFTSNDWNIPTSYTMNENTYTSGDYTITLYSPNGGSNGYRFISNDPSYLILGQQNAYLELPAFSSPVEKIEVVGRKGASPQVHHNIYVGDVAVSTETIGDAINNQKDTTQTYVIDENYRAAGTHYRLKVTSSGHRTQITYIKVYFAPAPPQPHTVRMAEGTEDAANWSLASGNASVPGNQVLENVMSGSQVTATYNGTTKKVKSVKAVKYVAPEVTTVTWNSTNVFNSNHQFDELSRWNTAPLTYEGITISFSGTGFSTFSPYDHSAEAGRLTCFGEDGDSYTFTAPDGKKFCKIEIIDNVSIAIDEYDDWTEDVVNHKIVWSGTAASTVTLGTVDTYASHLNSIVFKLIDAQ